MKSINITSYIRYDEENIYRVWLGNGTCSEFKNKVKAEKFLAETNTFLTNCLVKINRIYADSFTHYRNHWFYFDHNKPTKAGYKARLYHNCRLCKENFDAIDKLISKIVLRSNHKLGNYYTFIDLQKVIMYSMENINILKIISKRRSQTMINYDLSDLLERLLSIEQSINSYNKIEAIRLFKMPHEVSIRLNPPHREMYVA